MEFEGVVGLEIHVQISTKTKMFCRCDNDSFDVSPNINICPVCMGFPGQLPVINKVAVDKGIRTALALNCKILNFSKFDRKNYFYPDNPKGFQISQFDEPLSENGFVEFDIGSENGEAYRVGITRLHLEDDAGKLIHVRNGSLVDFNRAGTPLMEIVSEPHMHNGEQAGAYAREIQKIVRYIGSGDADMEKGMMRFDASVSIRRKGENILNPRAEIKNLNSFRSLENAVDFEIKRQISLYEDATPLNKPVTLGWNVEKQETFFMREKEESDDYRYFPEPDIPPLQISDKYINELKKNMPELPHIKKERFINELNLKEDDARILTSDPALANYFENVVEISGDPHAAVSFINTVLMKHLKEELVEIVDQKVTPEMMAELILLVKEGSISNNVAKSDVFEEMYVTGLSPKRIVEEKGLKQVSDTSLIEKMCRKVIEENSDSVRDIKNGKDRAIGYLIGLVMKESKGQANPKIVNNIIRKLIW